MSARWRYILGEALVGLRRNLLMTFAVILSVTVSLTLLGASLLLSQQVTLATDDWMDKVEVSIFLCNERSCGVDITEEQRQQLLDDLDAQPIVEQVFFESQADAYERFREMFKDDADVRDVVEPDSLPASFRVKLEDPSEFDVIAQQFEAYPGVEDIVDQQELLDDLLRFIDVVRRAAFIVAGIQLVAAGVLIANTIRVAAFARREQTSIMKLVGASNWYVRLPFLFEGMFAGALGAVLAWGLLMLSVPRVAANLREQVSLVPFIGSSAVIAIAPWMLLVGVGIAAVASLIALRRFLDV
ncbi:permease-like cell division protein FtsX [Nitriliruptor alkaliphilus]|uniref:permease-like cell division protein FtsX n=1 Tax=Nitriliruptor alkaliphilus TaxID=427918 RepID=UPI000698CE35|nr:permease-like cell division protein FtsX [Nitriliruptor alkaliphilus]